MKMWGILGPRDSKGKRLRIGGTVFFEWASQWDEEPFTALGTVAGFARKNFFGQPLAGQVILTAKIFRGRSHFVERQYIIKTTPEAAMLWQLENV